MKEIVDEVRLAMLLYSFRPNMRRRTTHPNHSIVCCAKSISSFLRRLLILPYPKYPPTPLLNLLIVCRRFLLGK